jgi:hypothetical protein
MLFYHIQHTYLSISAAAVSECFKVKAHIFSKHSDFQLSPKKQYNVQHGSQQNT